MKPPGSQIVRIVPSDQLCDEAFAHGIRDVATEVIPAVEIQSEPNLPESSPSIRLPRSG
jgi:hypothetical protein